MLSPVGIRVIYALIIVIAAYAGALVGIIIGEIRDRRK